MLLRHIDQKFNFVSWFDPDNGFYMRTGIRGEDGRDTGVDPFMASFPELIDIGIMGHCQHGRSGLCVASGTECYQDGLHIQKPNMSYNNFKKIIDECEGKVYQVALGGRGDPDQHENFVDILRYCRSKLIVPNFTSSGLGFSAPIIDAAKKYCGAVAVSWYRQPYTLQAINMLLAAGIKTNIHYILNNDTIDEAIQHLQKDDFPDGINAVLFLLHKPIGLGTKDKVLKADDPRVIAFFKVVDSYRGKLKVGFDSCSVPGILNFTENISRDSVDTCEGARYSMYISSDMIAMPCSFANQKAKWHFDISGHTIQEAWDSMQFDLFRSHYDLSCPNCPDHRACLGGCPIVSDIVLCNRAEKDIA